MKTLIAALLSLAVVGAAVPAQAGFTIKDIPASEGPGFGPADVKGTDGPAFGPADVKGFDGPAIGPELPTVDGPGL